MEPQAKSSEKHDASDNAAAERKEESKDTTAATTTTKGTTTTTTKEDLTAKAEVPLPATLKPIATHIGAPDSPSDQSGSGGAAGSGGQGGPPPLQPDGALSRFLFSRLLLR